MYSEFFNDTFSSVKTSDSAIGQHLLDNPDCVKVDNDDMFQLIGRARSSFSSSSFEIVLHTNEKNRYCIDRRSSVIFL